MAFKQHFARCPDFHAAKTSCLDVSFHDVRVFDVISLVL